MKTCIDCNKEKDLDNFYKQHTTQDGYRSICKSCANLKVKQWEKENPAKIKETRKKRNKSLYVPKDAPVGRPTQERSKSKIYGVYREDIKDWFNENNKCEICKIEMVIGKSNIGMCIDHNHSTNVFRGLLCKRCNLLLGCARDNITILQEAIQYLETHN